MQSFALNFNVVLSDFEAHAHEQRATTDGLTSHAEFAVAELKALPQQLRERLDDQLENLLNKLAYSTELGHHELSTALSKVLLVQSLVVQSNV